MTEWFGVDVKVLPAASEAVESALNTMGAMGTSVDSLRQTADAPVTVTGYFEEAVSLEDVEDAVVSEFGHAGLDRDEILNIEFRTVEEQDWLAEWKKHWTPTEVGQFVIAPPWFDLAPIDDKHIIRIEPNMAFGTGTHETTQLCLEALGDTVTPGMSVIDVGTGTGILAIAAAQLGCKHVRAYDTDAPSIDIAEKNAEANGAIESINFFKGSIDKDTAPADLIIANLTLDVILPMLDMLVEKADIALLLSGILEVQRPEIEAELQRFDIGDVTIKQRGEWISVLVGT